MTVFSRRIHCMLLAIALALPLAACGSAEERESGHFQRGIEYFETGDRERALVEFRNVTQINPKNSEAYFYIARIYEAKGLWPKAFSSYLKTVENAPAHVDANVRLGRMYVLAGNYEDALERSAVAIEADATNAEAVALRGAVYLRQGKYDEAREEALQALALDHASITASAVLAAYYRSQDQERKAISVLEKGLELNPAEPSLRLLKVALHINRRERDAAEIDMRVLVDTFPGRAQYWTSLAKLYVSWGRLDDAESVLREAIAANPDTDETKLLLIDFIENQKKLLTAAEDELTAFIDSAPESIALRFGLAELYDRHDRRDAAMGVLREIGTRDVTGPQGIRAKVSLARLHLLADDRPAALMLIDEVIGLEPRNPAALILRAQVSFDEGDFENAIADLRTTLGGDPNSITALALLSQAYLREDNAGLAISSLQRLVELRPNAYARKLQLSQLLAKKGDLDSALRYLDGSIESSSLIVPWLTTKAEFLIQMRRYAEARRATEKVKAAPRGEAAYWALVGKTAFAKGRFEAAARAFEKARAIDPVTGSFLSGLVKALVRLERYGDAAKSLQDYLVDRPDDTDALLRLGDINFQLKDFTAALAAYRDVSISDPKNSTSHLKLAQVYFHLNRDDDAFEALRRAVQEIPDSESLSIVLALNQQRLGKFREAIATYRAYLEINPGSVIAANNMGALIADHENKDPAALRRALSLVVPLQTSNNPQFLDTIGWLYYRAGEAPQAIVFLKRAIDLAPLSPEINYHMGMALLEAEQVALAREHLEKALPEGADLPFTEAARKALSTTPDT